MIPSTAAEAGAIIEAIVEKIRPHLAGIGPELQGAVLADLTSMWLASFQGPAARKLRRDLLAKHVEMIKRLTVINEKIILDAMADEKGTRQ
jgi:hypothetical protein